MCFLFQTALDTATTGISEALAPISVLIRDMRFDGNIGMTSTIGAFHDILNITIIDSFFTNNIAVSASAGIIIRPFEDENSYLSVKNCEFRNNSAAAQGVITILDDRGDQTESEYTLDWQVSGCVFKDNKAQALGAAISSSGYLFFSATSGVTNTRFERNTGSDRGSALRFEFSTGIITIFNCDFQNNQGKQGVAFYAEYHSISSIPTYVKLDTCRFSGNSGDSLVKVSDILHPILITSRLTFISNSGSCIWIDNGKWEDSNSICTSNSASQGAYAVLTNGAIGKSLYATVTDNSVTLKGGVAAVATYSNLTLVNATLARNHCANMAGGIYINQLSYISLVNVLFFGNTCVGKGSAIISIASQLYIENCRFTENKSGHLSLIGILESSMIMLKSELNGNIAGERAPGIVAMNSNLTVTGTLFRNQTAADMGAFLYVRDLSTAVISGCEFRDGNGPQAGAIFLGLRSTMMIANSVFSGCSGEKYSGVLQCRICTLRLTGVTIENCTAAVGAALFTFNQGAVTVTNSSFRNYTGSAISADAASNVLVSQVSFTGGVAVYGAAIKVTDSSLVALNCEFRSCVAKLGGGVYAQVTDKAGTKFALNVSESRFEHCQGVNGGAIYADGITLNLRGNKFLNNSALPTAQSIELVDRGRGGAVYATSVFQTSCTYSLVENNFSSNLAKEQGGAFYWSYSYPLLKDNLYTNNTAEYGADIASYPIRMTHIYSNGSLAPYSSWKDGEPTVYELTDIGSGQVFDGVIRVGLVDHYGNIFAADNSSDALLKSRDQSVVAVVGNVHSIASKGVYVFRNISFLGVPGTIQRIHIVSTAIDPDLRISAGDPNSYYRSVAIQLSFRNCTLGETQQGIKCYVCPGGTYSLDPMQPCKTCPLHAICLGNWTMVPEPGYWRPDPTFETFFQCPNMDSCLGSPDMRHPSLIGECIGGYTGNLCSVCESGYSRQGRNLCNKCPNLTSNLVLSSLIGIGGILLLIIAGAISIRGATRPRSEFAIYLKIFTNYVQMVVVAAALNVNWLGFVALFLNGQQTVGSVTDQLFSFECLGQEMFSMDGMFYKKIIGYVLLPVFLLCFAICLWICIKICTKMRAVPHKVVTSMVIIIFVLHPSLTKVTFSIFSCSELLPGEFWLIADMSIRCWDIHHLKNIVSIALPSIIVWVFGLPLLTLGLLYRSRQKLSAELIQIKYSFLYKGFRPEYFYWEFVILYRKVALVCASVFLSSISTMVQALSILAILLFCLFIQAAIKPFRTPVFNVLETKSILVSLLTIYVGLYFQANTWRIEINIVLFIVILLANIYFLVSWIRKIVPIVVSTIIHTLRRTAENLPVRPGDIQGADNSDLSNSKDSVIRAGDTRAAVDRSMAVVDVPPPNTTHGLYTLGLLDRPEDLRGKEELAYQFPDEISPELQEDKIYPAEDQSPLTPPEEIGCVIEEEEKVPDPQLDETFDPEKTAIDPRLE